MAKPFIRINGTAPAWPLMLGTIHPFYPPDEAYSLASASYSICGSSGKLNWELLIDAGHQTVPFLINHGNHIPDAILLTHAHPDHILGIDWVVQSNRFTKSSNSLPIYCTQGVWETLLKTYSHIQPYVIHKPLLYGIRTVIEEAKGMSVTAFPVYHGTGATGSSMLLFDQDNVSSKPVLFTGDLLCPLLRRKDMKRVGEAQLMFIDSNNRFPFPESNHISFTLKQEKEYLKKWLDNITLHDLISTHEPRLNANKEYFDEFLSDWNEPVKLPLSITEFIKNVPIPIVYLIHYWGVYDEKYYNQPLLNQPLLEKWANTQAALEEIVNIKFKVPKISQIIYF